MLATALERMRAVLRTRRDYMAYGERCAVHSQKAPTGSLAKAILDDVRKNGYHITRDYWSRDRCAAAVEEVNHLLRQYPQFVHPAPKSDVRLFGAEALSDLIADFGADPVLAEVASLHNRMPSRLGMTLAARLTAKPNNLGSGEGWHRDQFFVATKAMLYLTDVTLENGPFQLIGGSFALGTIYRDMVRAGLGHMQYRVRDDQATALLKANPARLHSFAAPAGTLIVFNASSIHRGKPIESGARYALTNYYFTSEWSDEEINRHFAPVARR